MILASQRCVIRGQAPCELAKDLVTPCGGQSRARAELVLIDGRPQPSNCTCNSIFFNVWSACLFSDGNSTLPISDQWKSECNQKSINFTDGYVHMEQFDVPSWAFVPLPQNATFDAKLAINDATKSKGWTTAQKLASVVVGLGSAIVFFTIFFLVWRWKLLSRVKGWSRNRQPGFPMTRRRVRSVHKANLDGFFIDSPQDEDFEDVGYPSAHGHNGYRISLPLYNRDRSPSVGPVWSLPGKSLWKKLSIKGRLQAMPAIPRPWKKKPIPVKSFPAPNNWRLDGRSSITRSPHSGHFSIKFPFTSATNGPSKLRQEAIFEDPDNYSDSGSDRDRHEYEYASLISPKPRPPEDVMIISPNGDDFTLESGETQPGRAVVRVTPPSPKIPSRTGPHHHPPRIDIPPAPREPAPQPPILPRPAVSTNANSTPSAHPQHPQIEETVHSNLENHRRIPSAEIMHASAEYQRSLRRLAHLAIRHPATTTLHPTQRRRNFLPRIHLANTFPFSRLSNLAVGAAQVPLNLR
ncbi:hypothetical protein BD779DRAFT_1062965 [Infundibulicybe gibba]|nr:hypothetical protein BD779DRAFT_1062965 [Infundibulicybe gibba]